MAPDRTESKYINVAESVELHILERGTGSPIVFIPGLTFSGEVFQSPDRAFCEQPAGYRDRPAQPGNVVQGFARQRLLNPRP